MSKFFFIFFACIIFSLAIIGVVLFVNPAEQKILWAIVVIYLAAIILMAYNWVQDFKKATKSDGDDM
ncbi:MAG: hypothetical protein Q8P37_00175 [Candidatus Spechtbacteria bacterium]|nr:hypothetical protein [Candidatus Spechtbacteria bacterium]